MIKSFLSVFISIVCSTIVHAQTIDQLIKKFDKSIDSLHTINEFNGNILLVKNGIRLYEKSIGFTNSKANQRLNSSSAFNLASISKTFTGMAALKLWEQDKLDLKAPVTKYLANFPYTDVTIEQLLSHRSGLPDYTYFMESHQYKTIKVKNRRGRWVKKLQLIKSETPFRQGLYNNQDVLDYMASKRPAPAAKPDRVFKYCNTNFVMLALIIEKISGQDFPTYMAETLFKPLKMDNTFIFSAKSIDKYTPSYNARMVPYRIEKYDCIYGDKNVYSTARDMYLWDKALTEGTYIKASTLEMAFQPQSPTNKYYHNYGLGWRILAKPNEERLVYHNGWWHGNNTVFTRLISESATIIILGNKFNKSIYKGKEIASVFTGKVDTTSLVE